MSIDFQKLPFHNFDKLDVLAKQVVEGFMIGLHKSPYHGFSVEFAEHRLHNIGDNIKDIDWKVYARTDKMYVKKFEEETNLRCQIVIDSSSSMNYPDQNTFSGYNKLEFSCVSAAALMYLLRKQRDAVGLTVFDEKIKIHTTAKVNIQHHKLLTTYLYQTLNNKSNATTNLSLTLHHIADALHKRSLVFIFSDAFSSESLEDIFKSFQHLKHNNHEVVFFNVLHTSSEIKLEYKNRPYKFVDLETGQQHKIQPQLIKSDYEVAANDYINAIKLKCAQYKIDFVDADIEKGYDAILLTYLTKRSKMK
jgi:uncharacterized protein (DUF58 family)